MSVQKIFSDENSLQRAINTFAILLIIGVVLPVLQPRYGGDVQIIFINFKLLSESGVKFLYKLGAIYPLIAGMAILIINHPQNYMKLFTKSLVIMIISIMPFLFLFSESSFIKQLSANQNLSNLIQYSVLGSIGMLLLLSSGLALKSNRSSLIVRLMSTVAASAYLISMLIPINDQLLIETFFNLLTYEGNSPGGLVNVLGLISLISTGLLITCSIYALLTWNYKYLTAKTGDLMVKLWVGSQLAILLGVVYSLIVSIAETRHGEEIGIALLIIIKLVILLYGLILLASISVANFITLLPETSSFTAPQASATFDTVSPINDSESIEKKLIKLKELFERGIINKEEYDLKKKEYINKL